MKSLITPTFSALVFLGMNCLAAEDAAVEPFIPGATPPIEEQVRQTQRLANEQFRSANENFRQAKDQHAQFLQSAHFAQAAAANGFGGDMFLAADDALQQVGQNFSLMIGGPAKAAFRPLIIRADKEDSDVNADLQEDLPVMLRILAKAAGTEAGRASEDWAMGIAVTTLGGPRAPQSMYLEGYGALFLVNVKFPLAAPPKPELEAKAEIEKDSTWEDAKQELFGDGNVRRSWMYASKGPKVEYSAERVNDLKQALLEALKSARNIRHLKPDEWITVVVTGGESETSTVIKRSGELEAWKALGKAKAAADKVMIARAVKGGAGESSQLVIRVKKSDVDALASGKLNAEDFQKRSQITTR